MSSGVVRSVLRGIVFDLDGVLIDSEPLMRYAFAASYRQVIGSGEPPIEQYLEHMGESFPAIMDKLGLPPTLWQPFRHICRQHIDQIRLFPESRGLLEWACTRDLKLAILTGKDRERTLEILDWFGLRSYFSVIVASDDLQQSKPHPEGLLRALDQLGCCAAETVMIGDSVSDVLCAQRAGVQAIGVTWGIKPERLQTCCRAEEIAHTWDELQQVLHDRAMKTIGSTTGLPQHPVLGFDIGGTQVRVALAIGDQIVARSAAHWPPGLSAEQEVGWIAGRALELVCSKGVTLRAAGAALAASLDGNGVVLSWPNRPAWQGLPFRALLAEQLALPLVVDDDANLAALAEHCFGAARGYQHALIIMAGTGIGAGLILDGRLFRGAHGWAGELGHMVVDREGPLCSCGRRGCVQVLAAGRALDLQAQAFGLADGPALTQAANQGDAVMGAVLAASARWLGLAAANLVNLLDLEAVVIGGGLALLGDPWWSTLATTIQDQLLKPTQQRVALHRAAFANDAGLMGAIALAYQQC